MRVFADTVYFGALLVPNDNLHDVAVGVAGRSGGDTFVTTDSVLSELERAIPKLRCLPDERPCGIKPHVVDEPHGLGARVYATLCDIRKELYRQRMDKGYSLTDCMSMVVCRDLGVTEVLSHDHHFEQEGFAILL